MVLIASLYTGGDYFVRGNNEKSNLEFFTGNEMVSHGR